MVVHINTYLDKRLWRVIYVTVVFFCLSLNDIIVNGILPIIDHICTANTNNARPCLPAAHASVFLVAATLIF